jgi:5-methylthioadenosine/S-adenosylhomocysteine deaminase
MGHGFLATLKLIDVGVRPSISIDIVTSIAGDMFGAMRMLLAGTRAVVNDEALRQRRIVDPLSPMSRDELEFATVQGARTCGLEAQTGSLTPGKAADIVLLDTDSLNLMPINNPHGVVVECAHAGNVDTVIVAGRIVKRDKRLLGVDLPRMRARVDAARDVLFRRTNVRPDGSWLPRPFSKGADIDG